MSERRGRASDPASRFVELKGRVDRATKLISELRETNYSLTAELAALHRRLEAIEAGETSVESDPPAPPPPAASEKHSSPAPPPVGAGVHEELQSLRDERKIIRAKVQGLLERIEKLEL